MQLVRLLVFGSIIAAASSVFAESPRSLADDFAKYPAGSEAAPNWQPDAVGWETANGDYCGDTGFSVWKEVPFASELTFSCDVTVTETPGAEWCVAGIALFADERNYWGLHLTASPEAAGRRLNTEMQEMLDGQWLAQAQVAKLESVPGQLGFQWKPGETYRMEIRLAGNEVRGFIRQGDRELARYGYRFRDGAKAVQAGRPALHASGAKARFDNATVTVSKTATEPEAARPLPVAWQSRPGESMASGTGFFRTFEKDGRWWLLDPEGKPFFSVGADHASYRGHWCEKLGYSPYHRNVEAKYGSEEAWAAKTLERLKAWGFNTLPAGHSASLRRQGLAHILFASFGSSFARREYICQPVHWTGFPDVFSPRWPAHCRLVADRMAKESLGDPWCIGIFLDNELEWYGKKGHLVDEIFLGSAQQSAKQALWKWLVQRFGNLAEVNRQLKTSYADEAAFLASDQVPAASEALELVRKEFLAVIAERYFEVPCQALRRADPNHLVLGCRFAGRVPEPVLAAAGKYNDVFTINTYPRVEFAWKNGPEDAEGTVETAPQQFVEYYATVRRPFMITEWSFPALDSGLPCKHGAGMRVDNQEQKAACYRIFAQAMADLPFVAGYQYFMWADEPALGISSTFPEDSNYGLVNERDETYETLVHVATQTNRDAAARHAKSREPQPVKPARRFGESDAMEAALAGAAFVPCPAGSFERKTLGAVWRCDRKNGSLFDSIVAGDLPLGRLVFAAHQAVDGRDFWTESTRISDLATFDSDKVWAIEATVERPGEAKGAPGFRARVRAATFKDRDLVFVRPIWIENIDSRAWRLVEAFCFCRSAIGGDPADDIVGGPDVPNYYRRSHFITDAKLGGRFGAQGQPNGWQVTFWKDPGGSIHPDARFRIDRELKPGERWTAENVPSLPVFASARRDAWQQDPARRHSSR